MKRVSIVLDFDQSVGDGAIREIFKALRISAFDLSRGGVGILKATQEHLRDGEIKNLLEAK